MLTTTLAAAWSRKRRLVGTALAIVLGVAFLTATLVVGDSARAGFANAFAEANAGTDALVRSSSRVGGEEITVAPIDAAVLDSVRSIDGVAAVAPLIEASGQVLDADGRGVGGDGPPTYAANWIDDEALTGWRLADGEAPDRPGEVVVDRGTAESADLGVGDTAFVLVPEPVTVTVVGVATFGDDDSIGGTTWVAFETGEAQRLLLGAPDRLTGVVVAADDGTSQDELVERLSAFLPDGVESISGDDLTAEMEAAIESDFLGFFNAALLAFAGVALLVAAFSIFNTFSILVAQRTGESALLRSLGASRRQVLVSALVEAAIVGVVGSVVGLGAGVLLASGLLSAMASAGFGLPVDGVALSGGTMVMSLVVGLVVTLLGGIGPALKASRVAPLAALREVSVDDTASSRWRLAAGLAGSAAGVAVVLSATSGTGGLPRAGLGAVLVVLGVVLLGPAAARPVGSVLGAPLRFRGVSGKLAARNAVRNPRRTAGTAAALLVGVGVVSLFTVFGASVSKSIEDAVDGAFGGDLVVEPGSWGGAGLAAATADELGDLPEVDASAGLGFGTVLIEGRNSEVGYTDPRQLAAIADFDVLEGDIREVDDSQIAMSRDHTAERGYSVGDTVEIVFADGATVPLRLSTIYDDRAMGGDVLLPVSVWSSHNAQTSYYTVLVGLADGVSLEEGRSAVEAATERFGSPTVRDRDEFVESQAAEIDSLLTVIYGLLGIAILIALMGIANTLSLSVHERTRELGLLRAVGQSRSQLRAMVRWESVIVAVFGSIGGLGLGLFLGWGLVRSLNAAEGFGTLAVPVGSLAVVLLVGAAVGVLAGLRPAWRASRMDVLAAVAED